MSSLLNFTLKTLHLFSRKDVIIGHNNLVNTCKTYLYHDNFIIYFKIYDILKIRLDLFSSEVIQNFFSLRRKNERFYGTIKVCLCVGS